MTPAERLKEIEVMYSERRLGWPEVDYLIARVKRLTEALEYYADESNCACRIDAHYPAKEALGDE